MRVFIALEMPVSARDQLRPCLTELGREMGGVRWVSARNLHLTLTFLGEISGEQLSNLRTELAMIVKGHLPFLLKFERAGLFKSGGEPSVVWLGIEPNERLGSLVKQVDLGCHRLVPSSDRKPFRPHITLGRVRQPYSGPPLERALERIEAISLDEWAVDAITVVKSDLTPKGPVYTTLSRHHLGGE